MIHPQQIDSSSHSHTYARMRTTKKINHQTHRQRARQIIVMNDVQLSPFVRVTGEPIPIKTLFNNHIVSKGLGRKHLSSLDDRKNDRSISSTKQWSLTVNRYLETYSKIKKGGINDKERVKTWTDVIDGDNKNETFVNFNGSRNAHRAQTYANESRCRFKTVIDTYSKPFHSQLQNKYFQVRPESINLKQRPHETKHPSLQTSPSKNIYLRYYEANKKKKQQENKNKSIVAQKKQSNGFFIENTVCLMPKHSFLISNKNKKPVKQLVFPKRQKSKQREMTKNNSSGLKQKEQIRRVQEWEDEIKIEPWGNQQIKSRLW